MAAGGFPFFLSFSWGPYEVGQSPHFTSEKGLTLRTSPVVWNGFLSSLLPPSGRILKLTMLDGGKLGNSTITDSKSEGGAMEDLLFCLFSPPPLDQSP